MHRFQPRFTRYIAQAPTPRQRAALLYNGLELFFGGAAGGGKSSWLLMAALQYVDIPGYSALILRQSLKDADNPASILFRARQWLSPFPEVRWWAKQNAWVFPSGAVLQFGYLANVNDCFQYDSAEYQFCGFDELTHFYQSDYEYLFSRLRKPFCPDHRDPDYGRRVNCLQCLQVGALRAVPIRMRSASNPGGKGHLWVKERFRIQPIPGKRGPTGKQLYQGTHPDRPHIPSFLDDNPYVDQEGYRRALSHIEDAVTRERKEAGDWGVAEDGRFRTSWIRRYTLRSRHLACDSSVYLLSQCRFFITVDPAASRKDTPGRTELTKKQASYTAIGLWCLTPANDLCLMHVSRVQVEIAEILSELRGVMSMQPYVEAVAMEWSAMSIHLFQWLQNAGLPMRAMKPYGQDKIARSVDASTRMEQGKLWLPSPGPAWLRDYEDELFTWTGHPEQVDDQVDMTSYAAIYVTSHPSVTELPSVV